MGTANFRTMNYGMPLIVGGILDFDEQKEIYEAEFDEEYTVDIHEQSLADWYEDAKFSAEEFGETLKYHRVGIRSGYYDGFQFTVEEITKKHFELDEDSIYCPDEEETQYYYDTDLKTALREAAEEKERIRKWLESLTEQGYMCLVCIGRFSNGEAIYKERKVKA